jgi:hypothetical protein
MIDPKTRFLAVAGSLALLVLVIELVRRRRLKEEYSVLWTLTAVTLLVLAIWYQLLLNITKAIGAVLPSSTLFFFALIFVMIMLLHFTVRISRLERNFTTLVQELGLMSVERDGLRAELELREADPGAEAPGLPPGQSP